MGLTLVTAASGTAGTHIVEALIGRNREVVATSRTPSKLSFTKSVQTRLYDADVATDFEALLEGVDNVVLIGPPLDGLLDRKLAPLVSAAAARRVTHLVYLSGNYLSGLTGATLEGAAVRKVEQQIIGSGLKHTLVRASFFMDNYTSGFYRPMIDKGTITLATGTGRSSLVAAEDVGVFVAEALVQGLTGEYLVTGPDFLDHYEVAELLSCFLQRPIQYQPLTEGQLLDAYKARGLRSETIDYGLTLYRSYRNQATVAVTDGFRQATGREPRSFAQFLGLATEAPPS